MRTQRNVALKTALFATGKEQQQIARLARISPQDLSHVISGRREFDARERARLLSVLRRHGVNTPEAELFPVSQEAVA